MMSPFSRRLVLLAFFVSAALLVSTTFAGPPMGAAPFGTGPGPGVGTVGGGFDLSGAFTTTIKTPPLSAGQTFSVPISVHNPGTAGPLSNWAGVLVEVHLVDNTELDVAAVHLAPGNLPVGVWAGASTISNPFGQPSNNATSVPRVFTAMHTAAFGSGISLGSSSFHPAITLDLVAKNTNVTGNSDVDIRLRFADIYHTPDQTFTTFIHLSSPFHPNGSTPINVVIPGSDNFFWQDSHRAWVRSDTNNLTDLHLTAGGHQQNSVNPFPNAVPPPSAPNGFDSLIAYPQAGDPATGHFLHFPDVLWHYVTSRYTGHVVGPISTTVQTSGFLTATVFIPGSHIFAVPFAATANIGIEHIPEPAAPILLLGGLASLMLGFRARRRRQQLA